MPKPARSKPAGGEKAATPRVDPAAVADALARTEGLVKRLDVLDALVSGAPPQPALAPVVPAAAAPINAIQITQMPGQPPAISWSGWSALEVVALLDIMRDLVKANLAMAPAAPAAG